MPRPVQWITEVAVGQIHSCSGNRTYTAGRRFACSCCATVLEHGVLLDNAWVAAHTPRRDGRVVVDPYDINYGSPLCVRCALFALVVCPWFAMLNHRHGEALQWTLVLDPGDYAEYDESAALELTEQGNTRQKVTTGWLREQFAAGLPR